VLPHAWIPIWPITLDKQQLRKKESLGDAQLYCGNCSFLCSITVNYIASAVRQFWWHFACWDTCLNFWTTGDSGFARRQRKWNLRVPSWSRGRGCSPSGMAFSMLFTNSFFFASIFAGSLVHYSLLLLPRHELVCGRRWTNSYGGVRLIWKPADFGWFNSILWEKTSRIKPGQDKRTGPWPALVVPFCPQSLEHDGSGVMLFRRQSPGGAHNSCFSVLAEENNFRASY